MGNFLIILSGSIMMLVWFFISFFSSIGSSSRDYWSEKQFAILRWICVGIGSLFLISIILVCLFSKDRFSDKTIRIMVILLITEFLSMGIFSQIVCFIAWRKKNQILKDNIKELLSEKRDVVDKSKLLKQCLIENRFHFTEKQVERCFKKVSQEYNNNSTRQDKISNE